MWVELSSRRNGILPTASSAKLTHRPVRGPTRAQRRLVLLHMLARLQKASDKILGNALALLLGHDDV